jgi:hypothetical protein
VGQRGRNGRAGDLPAAVPCGEDAGDTRVAAAAGEQRHSRGTEGCRRHLAHAAAPASRGGGEGRAADERVPLGVTGRAAAPSLAAMGAQARALTQARPSTPKISSAMMPWWTSTALNAATTVGSLILTPEFIPGMTSPCHHNYPGPGRGVRAGGVAGPAADRAALEIYLDPWARCHTTGGQAGPLLGENTPPGLP